MKQKLQITRIHALIAVSILAITTISNATSPNGASTACAAPDVILAGCDDLPCQHNINMLSQVSGGPGQNFLSGNSKCGLAIAPVECGGRTFMCGPRNAVGSQQAE